uniref:Phage protein n=1 Tax=Loa loa TaxID=7209 RepID=A0A1I7VER9_LOALO
MSFARTIIPPRQLRMSGLNYDDYDADDLIGDYFMSMLLLEHTIALMEGEFVNASGIGPNLPNLADLKKYLREEKPLYFQVLEQYLRNAANLVFIVYCY